MNAFTEAVVKHPVLVWLESLGWTVEHGPASRPPTVATTVKRILRTHGDQRDKQEKARKT